MKISRLFTTALAVMMLSSVGMIFGSGAANAATTPTVVLVHGAFADATSWDGVAADLRSRGYTVVVPDNPLRGPSYDASVIEKTVADIDGRVVLVGHSYGGAVISNVHDPKVQSMVYIAAFAPVAGEPVQITIDPIRFPGSQLLPPALAVKIVDDAHAIGGKNVDGYVADEYFHSVFAQDVSDDTAAVMLAHQKSIALWANLEPSGSPSWASVPTWYLVSDDDRVIPPSAQRFMANRMGANMSEVAASHASLVSQPSAVADVIVSATQG